MLVSPETAIWSIVLLAILLVCWRTRHWARRKVKRLLGFRFVSSFLIPIIAVVPPLVVAATDEKKKYWPTSFWQPIREFLDAHPAISTISLLWPIAVIVIAYGGGWIRKKFIDLDELTAKEYGLILGALDDVAGNKMERFGNLAAETLSATAAVNPGAIFPTITQPATQIAALLRGIYLVFLRDAESAGPQDPGVICVTLARLKKGQFEKFECWVPQHQQPNSSQPHLRRKDSAIERAAARRKPVIIKNIARELKRSGEKMFSRGAPGTSEEGSIIAYPVIHQATNDVPYVVTIRSQNAGHFATRLKQRYTILLQPFIIRISIEHSLALLRQYHASHNK